MVGFIPRIAIIGGGPAGLTLALLLYRKGIRSTIYELRKKPTSEELAKPSGMLDLHEESGLKALKECGLWEDFQSATGECSESTRVMTPDGVIVHTDEGELELRPEIARHALIRILCRQVPEEMIKWNHKIMAVRTNHCISGRVTETTLDFGPNGTATYDFVIGADGAWSRVRKLLTEVTPHYSGVQFLTVTVRHASTTYPHLVTLNGSGTLIALGNGNGLLTHRGPQDSIRIYAAISTPHENWVEVANLQGKSAKEVKPSLFEDEKLFGSWTPKLQDLLATACDEETKDNPSSPATISPLYMLPVGHGWEHQAGVTLIGDAAHLMTPFAGEGVNLAMWDSLDLAHVFAELPEVTEAAEWQAALDPKIREFEETMQERAQEKAEETARNMELMLSENGAQAMADMFKMYMDMFIAGEQPGKK